MSYDRVMPSCVELRYNLGEVRGVKNEHRGPIRGYSLLYCGCYEKCWSESMLVNVTRGDPLPKMTKARRIVSSKHKELVWNDQLPICVTGVVGGCLHWILQDVV